MCLTEEEFAGLERAIAAAKKIAPAKLQHPRNLPTQQQLQHCLNLFNAAYEDGDWDSLNNLGNALLNEYGVDWLPHIAAQLSLAMAFGGHPEALEAAQESYMNHPEQADAYFAIAVTQRDCRPKIGLRWLQLAFTAGLAPSYHTNQLKQALEDSLTFRT